MPLPLPPLHAAVCMLEAVSAAALLAELLAPATAMSSAWRMAPSERGARLEASGPFAWRNTRYSAG